MAESIADMVCRFTEQVTRAEYTLVERLIGAFAEETGRFPHVVHDDQRWWCDGFNDHPPTSSDWTHITPFAAAYRAMTDIPASKAMLVREFEGTMFSWRWEVRQ